MSERLIEIKQTDLNPTLRVLSDAGGTVDDFAWIRQGKNALLIIKIIHEHRNLANQNPFKQTVEEQIRRLREENQFWKSSGHPFIKDIDVVCSRLVDSAPAWPEGRDAYRSFRIRFGKGRDGMIKTAEAHCAAIKHVHAPKFWRWEYLLSDNHQYQGKDVDRLRLLAGNDSHKPVVEWIIIPDLQQYRKRDSITSVRGPKSLADEGLVLAWLVPDRVRAIDYKEWCAWFCAGYELNVPVLDDESWQYVVIVNRYLSDGTTHLHADWRGNADSVYSVPSVG